MRFLFSGRLCLRSQGFAEAEGSSGETSPLDFSLDFSEKTKSGAEVGDAGRGGGGGCLSEMGEVPTF